MPGPCEGWMLVNIITVQHMAWAQFYQDGFVFCKNYKIFETDWDLGNLIWTNQIHTKFQTGFDFCFLKIKF